MLARHGADGGVDKVWRDLQELQNDVVKLAQEMPSMLGEVSDGSLRAARERLDRMKKTLDVALASLNESGRNAAQSVNEMTHSIEDTFRGHPIAVIVAAVGVGYMLGLSNSGQEPPLADHRNLASQATAPRLGPRYQRYDPYAGFHRGFAHR